MAYPPCQSGIIPLRWHTLGPRDPLPRLEVGGRGNFRFSVQGFTRKKNVNNLFRHRYVTPVLVGKRPGPVSKNCAAARRRDDASYFRVDRTESPPTEARVKMSSGPVFLNALPPETEATDGDIVTFQVKVTGQPPPVVSWLHCGECVYHVPGRREIIHHPDGWHELILTNITQYDDGEYECRAENPHGHASTFGSLYYYDEGRADSTTEGTVEGTSTDEPGDTRLLILIDDGSETEGEEDGSYRKSLSATAQMESLVDGLEDVASTGTLEYVANDISEEQFSEAIDDSTSSLSALSPDQVVPEVQVFNNFGCGIIPVKAPLEYADISKGKTIRDRNDVVSLQLVADSYTTENCGSG